MTTNDDAIVDAPTWRRMTRREVLGLAPLSLLAAVVVPETREAILRGGLAATDRASGWFFRPMHLAPTYRDADLTPFDRFPINSYSAFVPSDADLAKWRLYVDGLVSRPGTYTFAWLFAATGVFYVGCRTATGHWRHVVLRPDEIGGVWLMLRYYIGRGATPQLP